jgi:hypothetical protein
MQVLEFFQRAMLASVRHWKRMVEERMVEERMVEERMVEERMAEEWLAGERLAGEWLTGERLAGEWNIHRSIVRLRLMVSLLPFLGEKGRCS